jgi:hypothetical protein
MNRRDFITLVGSAARRCGRLRRARMLAIVVGSHIARGLSLS